MIKVVRTSLSVAGAVLLALSVARGADSGQPTEKQKAEAIAKLQAAAKEILKPAANIPTQQAQAQALAPKPGEMRVMSVVDKRFVTSVSLAKLKSLASSDLPRAVGQFNQQADLIARAIPGMKGDVDRCKATAASLLKQFQDRVNTTRVGDQLKLTLEDNPQVIPGGLIKILIDAQVIQ